MPKAATEAAPKMVTTDCVSILLMALGSPSISKATFEMGNALDGARTASSFEHQFRPITAKAKELKARVDAGETFAPVTPLKKRGNMSPPTAPKKRKGSSEEEDNSTPTKKPAKKNTSKPRAKKIVDTHEEEEDKEQPASDSNGEDFSQDANTFIKSEQDWGRDYV